MQDRDVEFFFQNMNKLYEQYGHKFLAIKSLKILGAYDSFEDALNTTLKTEEPCTFIIKESVEKEKWFDDLSRFIEANIEYGKASKPL